MLTLLTKYILEFQQHLEASVMEEVIKIHRAKNDLVQQHCKYNKIIIIILEKDPDIQDK